MPSPSRFRLLATCLAATLSLALAGPAGAASKRKRTSPRPSAPAAAPAEAPAPIPAVAPEPVAPAQPVPAAASLPAEPVAAKVAVQEMAKSPGPRAKRIAVTDPTVVGDIPKRVLVAFSESLAPEVRKLQGLSAIGMGEIREMLMFDRQRQLLGCSEESCLEELGAALGVDELVSTSISALPSSYSITMRSVDMRKMKVVSSQNRQVAKADGEELLALVGPMIGGLFPDRELKPGKTRGVDKELARKVNPPPLARWVFYVTAGAAVAVAGGGATFGLLSRQSQKDYDALALSSQTTPVEGKRLTAIADTGQSQAKLANGLFIGAGVLALSAAVEAFFTDWHDDRGALKVSVLFGPSGGALAAKF